MGPTTA